MAVALPFLLGGMNLAAGISQTNSQLAGMDASANADDMNSAASRQMAGVALQQSGAEEEAQRKRARQVMGEQRAAMAQSGTGTTSSTNSSLALQSAKAAEQDALNIRYGGLLEAHGYNVKADQYTYQAKATRAQKKGVRASGYLGAAASGLSGYAAGGGKLTAGGS